MIERIGYRHGCLNHPRFTTRGEFQEGLCCFTRQTIRQQQETVFIYLAYIVQPLCGHAVAQKLFVGLVGKQARLGGRGHLLLHINRDNNLFHCLADLHQLRGPGLWVYL